MSVWCNLQSPTLSGRSPLEVRRTPVEMTGLQSLSGHCPVIFRSFSGQSLLKWKMAGIACPARLRRTLTGIWQNDLGFSLTSSLFSHGFLHHSILFIYLQAYFIFARAICEQKIYLYIHFISIAFCTIITSKNNIRNACTIARTHISEAKKLNKNKKRMYDCSYMRFRSQNI
jgi:hypothetical protein